MGNTDLTLRNSTSCPHSLLQNTTGLNAYAFFGLVLDSEKQAQKVLDNLYDKWAWNEKNNVL
jgi:hypothetical protein